MLRGFGMLMTLALVGASVTAANAGTLTKQEFNRAYDAAKANAPCLTADERSEIRTQVALRAWTSAAKSYTERHGWAVDDPRVVEANAKQEIVKDAAVEYLGYIRQVGSAYLRARSVNAQGADCSRIVMAYLHHSGLEVDGARFLTEQDLFATMDAGGGGDASLPGGFGNLGESMGGWGGKDCCVGFGLADIARYGGLAVLAADALCNCVPGPIKAAATLAAAVGGGGNGCGNCSSGNEPGTQR